MVRKNNFSDLDFLPSLENKSLIKNPNLTTINSVDLNRDGYKDIIFHIWSDGSSLDGGAFSPIQDKIFIYRSNGPRSYILDTSIAANEAALSLEGASRATAIGDINRDGYFDIAFAVNYEDKRPPGDDLSNWWASNSFLISDGVDGYRLSKVGPAAYNHTVTPLYDSEGGMQFLLGSRLGGEPSLAFRWDGAGLVQTDVFPPLTTSTNLAISSEVDGRITNLIFSGTLQTFNENLEPAIFSKSGNDWVLEDTYKFEPSDSASFIGSFGREALTKGIFDFKGHKIIDLAIYESQKLRLYPDKPSIVLAQLNSLELPFDHNEKVNQSDLLRFNYFVGFGISGSKLDFMPNLVVGQSPAAASYKFTVLDLNRDGYDDLISYSGDQFVGEELETFSRIAIYINNKHGQLVKDEKFNFPDIRHSGSSILQWPVALMDDFDNNGIVDILYYSTHPARWQTNARDFVPDSVVMGIHWGLADQFSSTGANITGDASDDVLNGSALSDYMEGLAGQDWIAAGDGDDTLVGGEGNDLLFGGAGIDSARYEGALKDYSIAQSGQKFIVTDLRSGSPESSDYLADIEYLWFGDQSIALFPGDTINGTQKNDVLMGDAGNDVISGMFGKDRLSGAGGNDSLYGGLGKDILSGGDGADSFYFDTRISSSNVDTITDFTAGSDKIYLSRSVFSNLETGALPDTAYLSTSAKGRPFTAEQHIIFNGKRLFFDVDGSGKSKPVPFCTLVGVTNLTAADFEVV